MTAPRPSNSPDSPNWMTTLGWAAYLGMSWTWCIGMFLPVLLVRDYGIWGFVVFAMPNVVGAAAMGWVLRDGASERIVNSHRAAAAAFSIITITFQAYFAGWFLFRLERTTSGYNGQYPLVVALTVAAISCVVIARALGIRGRWAWERLVSFGVLLVSLGAGVVMLKSGALELWQTPSLRLELGRHIDGLAWMAPVCAFGFALCPYLDLTFHRARQATRGGNARTSFGLGFGVLFATMILMTLAYTPLALGITGYPIFTSAAHVLIIALAVHLFSQLALTIWLHTVELLRLPQELRRRSIAILLVCLTIVAGMCFRIDWQVWGQLDMLLGEVVYRCFMSFYGLLFPAYVWICMIPTRDGHSGIDGPGGRRKLIVLAVAVLLAAPCFWMGFIERVEWWLVPGLGIVLFGRLLILRGPPPPPPAGEGGEARRRRVGA